MQRFYVFCDRPSNSANILRNKIKELGFKCKRLYGLLQPKGPGLVINWGSPRCNAGIGFPILNDPSKMQVASSKIKSLKIIEEAKIPCVHVTQSKEKADQWLKRGFRVFVRRDGMSQGRGITLYNGTQDLDKDCFYSRIFPKTHEFRVHVARGQAIDITQKKRSITAGKEADGLLRTHERGWVFAHEDLIITDTKDIDDLKHLCTDAVEALGLDFGAVDVLAVFDKKSPRRLSRAVICEVNTRPGLENTQTIEAYARAFTLPGEQVLARQAALVEPRREAA